MNKSRAATSSSPMYGHNYVVNAPTKSCLYAQLRWFMLSLLAGFHGSNAIHIQQTVITPAATYRCPSVHSTTRRPLPRELVNLAPVAR